MKKKFEMGSRVVWVERSNLDTHNEYEDDDTIRGIIKSVNDDGSFTVQWDNSWVNPNISNHKKKMN
jgi:hypothetical protein